MSRPRKSKTQGGVPAPVEKAKSPHAPELRRSAVLGGVTDDDGIPTSREVEAVALARARSAARSPALMMTHKDRVQGPYPDAEANNVRMLETFGTNSNLFLVQQITSLSNMLALKDADPDPNLSLNSAIAMVAAVAPENEIEAALAVQMAGTHELAADMLARAKRSQHLDHMNAYINAATKLQRTQVAQLEALARLRGKGQQTVRVEHVTVHPGGQAVVGDVHHHQHHPSSKDQVDAQPSGAVAREALPSPDPISQTLPGPSDAERPVSHARRSQHRRPEGKPKCAQTRLLHQELDAGAGKDSRHDEALSNASENIV